MTPETVVLRTRSVEDDQRLAAFEKRMSIPILVSALLPVLFSLTGQTSIIGNGILVATWIVFVVDLVVHVRLIPRYLRTGRGVFDLAVVILTAPWFLIPGLGDARFVMLARVARLFRVAKASGGGLVRLAKQVGRVGIVAGVLVVSCAYIAYGAEHATNPDFSTYGNALWWATVTITTVGYGDIVPITPTGRVVAAVLMFSGLGVLGVLAGSLASFFGFGEDQPAPEEAQAATAPADAEADLRARLDELEEAIAAVREQLG